MGKKITGAPKKCEKNFFGVTRYKTDFSIYLNETKFEKKCIKNKKK